MHKKCNKCKDGYQSIIHGAGRLKCKCEIPDNAHIENIIDSFKPMNDMIDDMLGIDKKEK